MCRLRARIFHGDDLALTTGSLIPRFSAFRDPDRVAVTLSRDGRYIAWLEPRFGVLNLMYSPASRPCEAVQVTHEMNRSIMPVLIWAHTSRHIVIFRDQEGDENYRAFSVNLNTCGEIPLTPPEGVKSFLCSDSALFPIHLLFAVNGRDPSIFDLVKVDVTNGSGEMLFENPGFNKLIVNRSFIVRFGQRVLNDGSVEVLERLPSGEWVSFLEIPALDARTTRLDRLSTDEQSVFLLDSRERDRAALFRVDLKSRAAILLAEDQDADITEVVYDPGTGWPLAAVAIVARRRWHCVEGSFASDLEHLLAQAGDAELSIIDINENGERYLVFIDRSDASGEFQLYERNSHGVRLFNERSDLERASLRPMRTVTISARDGWKLPGYLTLPCEDFLSGPMVLAIHGGPYDRDLWGYSATHQWLASRGYAVLSVNFRGSTGFGKAFVNAADHEWGGKMQDDLIDAVRWAIEGGYADPARVGAAGVSYGGYAALMCAARTPKVFSCVVDMFGPSNLLTFMESIPPYWKTWFAEIKHRLADPGTEAGRSWLLDRSPSTYADQITRPVMIAQGLRDVRVKPRESEQMVQALQQRGIPVMYVTFKDEGHFLARQENRIALAAVMEAFLARCLGGAEEPLGDAFAGSSISIESGRGFLDDGT
jgi:dipeptidyl aminopeptidase/acylaminoacyl peptidase